MSASDAAPLPRLGEVFFDVRGNSRSMRLSWYADTGVAVFSIWQGGRCTGTFRLPIDDLPRMIEILQRGPDQRRPRLQAADRPAGGYAAEAASADAEPTAYGLSAEFPFDEHGPADSYESADSAGEYGQPDSFETAAYPRAAREPAGREPGGREQGERGTAGRASRSGARRRSAAYRDGQPYADSPAGFGEPAADYADSPAAFGEPASDYADSPSRFGGPPSGYADSSLGYSDSGPDYHDVPAGYQESAGGYEDSAAGYRGDPGGFGDSRDPRGRAERDPVGRGPAGRGPAERGRESRRYAAAPDYAAQAEPQPGSYWQEEQDGYPPPRSPGQDPLDTRHADYGQDRFVPPYVQAHDEAYLNDNQGGGAGRRNLPGRPAYHADRSEDSAGSEWQPDQAWPDEGYSGGSDYRPVADPPPGPRHSAGRPGDR
jgi:hypothetical protein